ncbi:MAG: hypothetical protein IJO26_00615 [Clostridium sp.]|nr:hypothetical protein [Clostridium sp.]
MSCGCGTNKKDGKAIVDRLREKGKAELKLDNPYTIKCSCDNNITIDTFVTVCPNCKMTYGITPCSQNDINNIKEAGINY